MEPIRLWRWKDRMGVTGATTWHDSPLVDGMAEYAALPRADFDALVKRSGDAEREQQHLHDRRMALLTEVERATARADKAEAALKGALAQIDAHLAAKGQAAPTPADPTNPAPAATSGAGCTEQKEP